jgi:hypothetical protein
MTTGPTTSNHVTLRRNIQQIKHCVEEALSVIEHGEDHRSAIDDLEHASMLLKEVLPRLKTYGTVRKVPG